MFVQVEKSQGTRIVKIPFPPLLTLGTHAHHRPPHPENCLNCLRSYDTPAPLYYLAFNITHNSTSKIELKLVSLYDYSSYLEATLVTLLPPSIPLSTSRWHDCFQSLRGDGSRQLVSPWLYNELSQNDRKVLALASEIFKAFECPRHQVQPCWGYRDPIISTDTRREWGLRQLRYATWTAA